MTKRDCTTSKSPLQTKRARFTESVFLQRAIKQHGDSYGYDALGFINGKHKVRIYCKKCQSYFMQMPHNHANGQGCPSCSLERRARKKTRTTSEFISKAIEVHGDKYDYSESVYKPLPHKIKIFCRKCSQYFYQQGQYHLAGQGCPVCAGVKKSNTEEFIKKAIKLRGSDNYDFSKTKYTRAHDFVTITCRKHGDFKIRAYCFLDKRRSGCQHCSKEVMKAKIRTSLSEFLERSKEVHGDKYKYYELEYKKSSEKIRIHCPVHGDFFQLGTDHMLGRGCQYCSKEHNGFGASSFVANCNKNNSGNGTLYVIRCFNSNESFYKVGITSRTVRARCSSGMPYKYQVIAEIRGSAEYIYQLEKRLHSLLRFDKYEPKIGFKGSASECFTNIDSISKLTESLSSTKQLQLLA